MNKDTDKELLSRIEEETHEGSTIKSDSNAPISGSNLIPDDSTIIKGTAKFEADLKEQKVKITEIKDSRGKDIFGEGSLIGSTSATIGSQGTTVGSIGSTSKTDFGHGGGKRRTRRYKAGKKRRTKKQKRSKKKRSRRKK